MNLNPSPSGTPETRLFRLLSLLGLGFSSGLPLALSGASLQAWLTVEGVDIKTIGFLAIAGSPYTFKFLWAPLLDRFAPPFADHRRAWLILTQLALAGLLVGMALTGVRSPWLIGLLAFGLSALSATQDIAFDAYRTDVLPTQERGLGAAVSVAGYRLAMLTSGGLALILADQWLGWSTTYLAMAGLMATMALVSWNAPALPTPTQAPQSMSEAVKASWATFNAREGALWFLALIVLYKLGDAFAGSLSTAFLIRGAGFTPTEVGSLNKILGLVATLAGAFLGGGLLARWGLFRSLMVFGVLQAVSNLSFWALAVTDKSLWTMGIAIAIENICGGMGTAAFVALLTGLCASRYSATQYALLSALASFGRVYLSAPSGWFVEQLGWAQFFMFSVLVALPGLLLLALMRRQIEKLAG